MPQQHDFGGDWTSEKLERVRKYLVAYATIMNNYHFQFAYIDAFAGTGYRTLTRTDIPSELMFPEFAEKDSEAFLEGSARIALQIHPRFNKYIFIEKDAERFDELSKLKTDFKELQNEIELVRADANSYLAELCRKNWDKHRAVLFLDPYGMQVPWETIETIARTKAIDLWYLFPLGVAVNRLLKNDGNIDEPLRKKLDQIFGTTDWYEKFYETKTVPGLFGEHTATQKVANTEAIGRYFVARLKKLFAGIADNPLPLYNAKNNPLYLLCFASGNPKGAKTAVKIAQDILKR